MNFDVVVGNPPYGNLHLKILQISVEHLSPIGVGVFIQPVRWLQDPLWKVKKTTDAKKLQSVLDGKIDSVDVISGQEATRVFAVATFPMDLAIFTIKKSGGKLQYDALSQIVNGIDISAFTHLLANTGFTFDFYDEQMLNFVPIAIISDAKRSQRPNMHQQYGYYTNGKSNDCKFGNGLSLAETHKANRRRFIGKTIGAVVKSFATPEEAKNFYEYIKLDAFRFFIYVTTMDVHIQYNYLPYPKESDAFCTPWDNQRFYAYFKIAKPEEELITSVMQKLGSA